MNHSVSFSCRQEPRFFEECKILPLGVFLFFLLVGQFCLAQKSIDDLESASCYDHHVHLLSPSLISDWKSTGMPFSRPDDFYSSVQRLMNEEKLAGAFIVSMAHLYTTEAFQGLQKDVRDEQEFVARENDFVASCVAEYPESLVGFFSINPLRPYSIDELERCLSNDHLTGLKLHLPACGVDVQVEEHRRKLHAVLRWAAEHGVPVLLHYSAGEAIDDKAADFFWRELILPHENLELYLAHLGTAGGYHGAARSLIDGYERLRNENQDFSSRAIFFDLSGAIIPEGFPEGRPTSDARCQELSLKIQEIGVARFLFASDYPVFSVADSKSRLLHRLSLNEVEKTNLFDNRSPLFSKRPPGMAREPDK